MQTVVIFWYHKVRLIFELLELFPIKEITCKFTVDKITSLSNYDIILSRDLLLSLRINILFSKGYLA